MKPPFQLGTIIESDSDVSRKARPCDSGKDAERRSETRNGERMPVQFFDGCRGIGYQGVMINDSDGGAFIETDKTLPLLTEIRVEGPGLTCRAVVCRVHWLGPEERMTRSGGMAVRLISRKEHGRGAVLPFSPAVAAK